MREPIYYLRKPACIAIAAVMVAALMLAACNRHTGADRQRQESREAKQLLQGVWTDDADGDVIFQMQGDSVYYPDSTSMPACFWVEGDTLYIEPSARYPIEKHTEHLLWFRTPDGELVKLRKGDAEERAADFRESVPQVLTEVVKRDTVVNYHDQRYHLYVAVNPTRYKVVRTALNEDGLEVENVYYDNIIHLSIFRGATQLFSRDFRKQQYQGLMADGLLAQSVMNDMHYTGTDASGFHVNVSLSVPGEASYYLVEHTIDFDGQLSTKRP